MKRQVRIFTLIIIITLFITTCGCKNNTSQAVIYFELPDTPVALDPQTSSTDSELVIIRNIYEGLLRKNSKDEIVCGIAESYVQNNLTYTFKLRHNAVWSNKEPVTANDFVFAFKRAVLPETASPFAMRLYSIKNAERINKGNLSPDKLGVSAPDDYTLIIQLDKQDNDFKETLTTSICMPCNEKFFNESDGKYGLVSDKILSNGSYRLAKWNKETFGIRLYKNEDYKGKMSAKNAAIFITKDKKEEAIDKLKKNSVDVAFIDSSLTSTAKSNNLKTVDFQNICWVMTFNSDLSSGIRKSLSMLIGGEVFSKDLSDGYYVADSIYPKSISNEKHCAGLTDYNLSQAKKLFSREIEKLFDNKFPSSVKLLYYDNGIIKPVVTDIVGHWQNNLGAFVNIEAVDSADKLISQLQTQTLTIALFPVKADSSQIGEYLRKFDFSYANQNLDTVQSEILKNNHIIPIAFQNTTIAYSSSLNNLYTSLGNGYIDFSFVDKAE